MAQNGGTELTNQQLLTLRKEQERIKLSEVAKLQEHFEKHKNIRKEIIQKRIVGNGTHLKDFNVGPKRSDGVADVVKMLPVDWSTGGESFQMTQKPKSNGMKTSNVYSRNANVLSGQKGNVAPKDNSVSAAKKCTRARSGEFEGGGDTWW